MSEADADKKPSRWSNIESSSEEDEEEEDGGSYMHERPKSSSAQPISSLERLSLQQGTQQPGAEMGGRYKPPHSQQQPQRQDVFQARGNFKIQKDIDDGQRISASRDYRGQGGRPPVHAGSGATDGSRGVGGRFPGSAGRGTTGDFRTNTVQALTPRGGSGDVRKQHRPPATNPTPTSTSTSTSVSTATPTPTPAHVDNRVDGAKLASGAKVCTIL